MSLTADAQVTMSGGTLRRGRKPSSGSGPLVLTPAGAGTLIVGADDVCSSGATEDRRHARTSNRPSSIGALERRRQRHLAQDYFDRRIISSGALET